MSYTVIIPSRSPENVRSCITALRGSGCTARALVVIDSAVDVEQMKSAAGRENWRIGARPFVYAVNINAGISWATPDDVLLLNDDAILETPGGFDLLAVAARKHPEFGIVVPLVRGLTCCAEQRTPPCVPLPAKKPREARNHMVPFMCAYIRRDVINRVGLLPEDALFGDDGRPIYTGEDDIYCKRVRDAGYKLGILDSVVVEHESVPSTMRTNDDGSERRVDCRPARELYKRYFGLYPQEEQARIDKERNATI